MRMARFLLKTFYRYSKKQCLCAVVVITVFYTFATTTNFDFDWLRKRELSAESTDVWEMGEMKSASLQYRQRFDESRQYVIHDFAFVGQNWKVGMASSLPTACLATQASLPYLRHLFPLGRRWQGMVSVAVFVPDVDFHLTVLYLEHARRCYPEVLENVAVHLAYPVGFPPVVSANATGFSANACDDSAMDLSGVSLFNSSQILYPQNLLRNVARKSCPTDYVLMADIDMLPSQGLAPELEHFLATQGPCEKCAYVVPAYETNENATVPGNKSQLLDMVGQGLARPYRQKAFWENQGATNATLWESLSENGAVSIGYRLPCFKFYYEPFYLARDSAPPHNERFVGYGFTRNTQVFEMQLAGYRFFVLNNVFLIQHKMVDSPYSSPGRKMQVKLNTEIYKKLKKEFSVKYKKESELPCASVDS